MIVHIECIQALKAEEIHTVGQEVKHLSINNIEKRGQWPSQLFNYSKLEVIDSFFFLMNNDFLKTVEAHMSCIHN